MSSELQHENTFFPALHISLASVECTYPHDHGWPRQKSNKNHKPFSIGPTDFLTLFLQEKVASFYPMEVKEICMTTVTELCIRSNGQLEP